MPDTLLADARLNLRRAERLARAHRRELRRLERRLNRGGVPALARACLVVLFPFSGVDKLVHWEDALKQADSSILPKSFGPPMLVVGALVELVAPVCIVLGWHDRLAAFVLAGFCTVTALLFHQFWRYPDYWSKSGSEGNSHFWEFWKNFGLVGGLLLIVVGGRPVPASEFLDDPLGAAPMLAGA
jgi:putative oxidoreductase